MFDQIFRVLVAILLLSSVPSHNKVFLYLGSDKILELPTLAEVPCKQNTPFGPGSHLYIHGTAAVVPYGGVNTLMVCGLRFDLRGCYVWSKEGWEPSDFLYNNG